jgi:hypothetical protein
LSPRATTPIDFEARAAFAAMCGVNPVEASSEKIVRHRLNRSGNRQANHALWRIAFVRLSTDPTTKAYAAHRTAEGKDQREIIGCLKRYIAREIYRLIVEPGTVLTGADLRSIRLSRGFSLAIVATELGTSMNTISRLERALIHNTDLAQRATSIGSPVLQTQRSNERLDKNRSIRAEEGEILHIDGSVHAVGSHPNSYPLHTIKSKSYFLLPDL